MLVRKALTCLDSVPVLIALAQDPEIWILFWLLLLSFWLETGHRMSPLVATHGFFQENRHYKPCSGFSGCPAPLSSSHSLFAPPGKSNLPRPGPLHLSGFGAQSCLSLASDRLFQGTARQRHPSQTLRRNCVRNNHLSLQIFPSCWAPYACS